GSVITYTNTIQSSYSNTDSGIGELLLVKPAEFSHWSNLQVWTNDRQMTLLTAGTQVGANQVLVTTNSNNVRIRFLQSLPDTGGVIKNNGIVIKVVYSLVAPTNTSTSGLEFKTYADCIKYNYTGYNLWATTGKKKAYPAVPDGTLVKVYNQPKALASLTPNSMYEATEDYTFTYKIATALNNDGPSLSRAMINVPAGFNVYPGEVTSSLINTNYVKITNGNDIVLKYSDAGTFIPSQNGLDQITIKVHNTPPDGIYQFTCQVESVIQGAAPQLATTNDVYLTQKVLVLPEKPKVYAYVQPDHIYNISETNVLSYYLLNNGSTGNDINKARIYLPGIFTNAGKLSSDTVSTQYISYHKSTNYFVIDYNGAGTNILAGRYDRVRIKTWDNVPAVKTTNADIPSDTDNGNGDGYVNCYEDVTGWLLSVTDPVSEGQASLFTNTIFTTDVTNRFTYRIFNSAVMAGNNIYRAKVRIPKSFTNIQNTASSRIANDSNTNYILIKSNLLYLNYYKEGTNTILKQGNLDTVTFRLSDKIQVPTICTLQSYVANSSNTNSFRITGNYLTGNKNLNIMHPNTCGDAYILPNDLDATTLTNTMQICIRNTGRQENEIKLVRITFSTSFITNVDNLTSQVIINLPAVNVKYIKPDILLRYENDGSPLITGMTDIIRFRMYDKALSGGTLIAGVSASNIKYYQALSATPAKSLQVEFTLPDPLAQGSVQPNVLFTSSDRTTNILVYQVTNKGEESNDLKKVKLTYSVLLKNKVIDVSNTWSPAQTLITVNSDSILLDYTNKLLTGSSDRIYLVVTNRMASPGSNFIIQMSADNDNGNGFISGLTNLNFTRKVMYTKQPNVSLTPTWIHTISTSNTFQYTVKNGSVGGSAIQRLRIAVPVPVFVTNGLLLMNNTWYTQFTLLQREGNDIIVDYSAKPLDPDNTDIIRFNVKDNFSTSTTNVAWPAYIDYGDGYGWRPACVNPGDTNSVTFIMPPASAKADFNPKLVSTDEIATWFTLVLTNDGVAGNNIKLAKVKIPAGISTVTSLTSTLIGTALKYTNSSIFLNYEKQGSAIPVAGKDVIRFLGYDTITVPGTVQWEVHAANTTNTNSLTLAPGIYTNSTKLSFYLPDYGAEFYITPNMIDTSVNTTTMTLFIRNKSGTTNNNNIRSVRLNYPSVFTNISGMSNSKATNITFISNRIIQLTYDPATFKPGQSDILVFRVRDSLSSGYSNISFDCRINFTSSGGNYPLGDVVTGKSKDVAFNMPLPEAESVIEPGEIYTTSRTNRIKYHLINKGKGSNGLTKAVISVPGYFTNRLSLSGSLATNWKYTNSQIILKYNNLPSSVTDAMTLVFVNTWTNTLASRNFPCAVSNGYLSSFSISNDSRLAVVTPPSVYAEPGSTYSTIITNTFRLYFYNDGSGTSPVRSARISVPVFLTNIIEVQSTKLNSQNNISNKRREIVLNYSADANGPLLDNESDMITVRLIDNLS
ncbi:MAG: hypothetical protein PHF84_11560, partial [bacterium]|nr:hypothetical protein [bacterium]